VDILEKSKPSRKITVTLRCKPYLAKFVHSVYGSPLAADSNSLLGSYIYLCLSKNMYENRHLYHHKRAIPQSSIQIKISKWQFNSIGFHIPEDKAISINSFIEKTFTEHLYNWCFVHTKKEVRFKGYDDQIRSFAAHHNIVLDDDNQDISFDALKKKEYRYRVNLEKNRTAFQKIFFAEMSPRI
jgi:hypothetical protein